MRCLVGLLFSSLLIVPAQAEIVPVESAELQQLVDSGVPLIDVRTAGEWQETGVIEGSYLMTFFDEQGRADPEAWLETLERIAGPDQPVALICASGGRTAAISHFLDQQVGYQRVYHAEDGIVDWLKQSRPVIQVGATVADQSCESVRSGVAAAAC